MNRIVHFIFFIFIASVLSRGVCSADSASSMTGLDPVIRAAVSILDPDMAEAVKNAYSQEDIIFPHTFPSEGKITEPGSLPDYFPADSNLRLEYDHTGSEFPGTRRIIMEFNGMSALEGPVVTHAVMTVINGSVVEGTSVINITRTDKGVYVSDSITSGSRREIAFPIVPGKVWTENSDISRISSLKASMAVPAGQFSNCLKIAVRLGGGDAGSSVRYYAPGVGLVYEEISGESGHDTVKLISYNKMEN
ncbi:MAG: hypothetical protein ABIG11_09625 [bacterium]